MKAINLKKIILFLVVSTVLILISQNTFAGAPAGHLSSLEPHLSNILQKRLQYFNYLQQIDNEHEFSLAISAFLWDNRSKLAYIKFSKAREVDAVVCLMIRKGYSEFDEYYNMDNDFCSRFFKDTPDQN
ncbi:MAG: hypothetical protein GY857_14095 [Desulfobacula sp.]|nr:hypothetical protein [Desulfobacula sp.]